MKAVSSALTVRVNSSARRRGRAIRVAARDWGIFPLLLLFMGVAGFIAPTFLTELNLRNVLDQASILGILSLGQFLVVLVGGFDLSVAAVMALSSVTMALLAPVSLPLAMCAGVMAGLGIGALNGIAVTFGRVPPLIATLGMMGVARGLAFAVTEKSVLVPQETLAPVQVELGILTGPALGWLILTALLAFLLARTRPGRHLYALGGNERAAKLAGLPITRLQLAVYASSGALAGLAGVALVVRSSSGVPLAGTGWELDAIAAIVLGGARLFGGEGKLVSAMAGVLLYRMISNVLNLTGLDPFYQDIAKALIIIAVVGGSMVLTSRGRTQA